MKIIHFFNELKYSGAEIMYVDACNEFQKLGCNLTAVNTSLKLGEFASSFEKAGYKVLHLPYPKNLLGRIRYCNSVIKILRDEKYDIVHIHSSTLKWCIAYCAWKANCKSIYTFHNVFKSHWYSYLWHFWLRWCAKNIFNCKFQSISDSVYDNEKNYYHNNTIKIYNWYSNYRFFPALQNEKKSVRKKLQISDEALVIVSVGGCSPIKRHTEVIKALKEILKTYSNTIYIHLGEGTSLPNEKELAKELGVSEHILFCGNQDNVRQYLIASDMYVMPSIFEGIPITTIEAMACNIPTILYNVPGLRDFNKEKECSLLIKEDYKLLAQTIIKLYQDKNKQLYLTNNAKSFVDSQFYMKNNIKKIFELYKK